jgi:hypothetical protein
MRVLAALVTAVTLGTSLAGPVPALGDEGGRGTAVGSSTGNETSWPVPSGSYLRATLHTWSQSAGWMLVWDSPLDYRIRAAAQFRGNYEDAVRRLVDAIHETNPELRATLYRGNRVLHVETVPVETR